MRRTEKRFFQRERQMPEANMFVERRAHPRISVKVPVKYRLVQNQKEVASISKWREEEKHGQTLDISLGGMYVVMDQPLAKGDIIKSDITLPNRSNLMGVYAEVVWTNETGTGLHFLMIRDEDIEFLKAYLDQMASDKPRD
jgi:c-di-GMP-binding flagellar brake protein YcgR